MNSVERTWQWMRRHSGVIGGVAAVLTGLITLAIFLVGDDLLNTSGQRIDDPGALISPNPAVPEPEERESQGGSSSQDSGAGGNPEESRTTEAGSINSVSVICPTTAEPGETVLVEYAIAVSEAEVTVGLGAVLRADTGDVYDEANDRDVPLGTGTHSVRRSFAVPADIPPGEYELTAFVYRDDATGDDTYLPHDCNLRVGQDTTPPPDLGDDVSVAPAVLGQELLSVDSDACSTTWFVAPVTINAQPFSHALVCNARTATNAGRFGWLEYNLARKYTHFEAYVGLRDDSETGSKVLFELVDENGRVIEAVEVPFGDLELIEADVTNVLRLRLQVTATQGESYPAFASPTVSS